MQYHTPHSHSLSQVVIEILTRRGYAREELEDFFSWDLKKLPVLTQLKGLDTCAERILQALDQNEKIAIYGDYDVDGTTSCALFASFFRMLGVEVGLYQPSRFVEGYGIHPCSIDRAIEDGTDLLITVDCGISNCETAAYAKERGIDLIITDHHKDAQEFMPDALAIVNPNRRDEDLDSPLTKLAGVGVAFCVCLKTKIEMEKRGQSCPSLYNLLGHVAVGTICDMAHLNPMNMKLTRHGLKLIADGLYPGYNVFFPEEKRKIHSFMPSEVASFQVGPHINSKGRLDHPEKSLQLLLSKDSTEAYQYYTHLEIANNERKKIQSEVFQQAKLQFIEKMDESNPLSCIAYHPEWHEGVIGIVASKLVETFEIPAIVFTDSEDPELIKASARSAGELNIFDLLHQCKDLFKKFGGHKAAAGLSMPKEKFEEFKQKFNELLREIPEISRTVQSQYDLVLPFEQISPRLVKDLEKLEPFGMGNPRPKFLCRDIEIDSFKILKEKHVKWSFRSSAGAGPKQGGISFNFIGAWNQLSPEELFERQKTTPLEALFTLGFNHFRGNTFVQLMVEKIRPQL